MSHWTIDQHRTSLRISFQPGLPGVGVHVRGVNGSFEATIDEHGRPDLDREIHGEFSVTVDDLQLGNKLLTAAVKPWLGGDDEVAIVGEIHRIEPYDDERYRMHLRMTMRGETHEIESRGRSRLTADGDLRVLGKTKVDPRDLGVPIPKVLRLRSIAEWDIHLVPDP